MLTDKQKEFDWNRIQQSIAEDAADYFKGNPTLNADQARDAACEYADSHENVIYTWRSRSVWFESTEVQDYETSGEFDENMDIDKRITFCVYFAYQVTFCEALEALMNKRDDEAGCYPIAW